MSSESIMLLFLKNDGMGRLSVICECTVFACDKRENRLRFVLNFFVENVSVVNDLKRYLTIAVIAWAWVETSE